MSGLEFFHIFFESFQLFVSFVKFFICSLDIFSEKIDAWIVGTIFSGYIGRRSNFRKVFIGGKASTFEFFLNFCQFFSQEVKATDNNVIIVEARRTDRVLIEGSSENRISLR